MSAGLAVAIHTYGYQDHTRPADVIVILGAGVRRDNEPTAAQRNRSRRGAELWHAGAAPYIICTGGFPGYATRSEADTCREILVERGVPGDRIVLEERSRSTVENARYAGELMAEQGWNDAIIVSDRYHLFRAGAVFSAAGITAYTSPASVSGLGTPRYLFMLGREVLAVQWQMVIDALNLPFTHVPLV